MKETKQRAWETSSLVLCEIIQSEWYTEFIIFVNRNRPLFRERPARLFSSPGPFVALERGRTRRSRWFGEPIKALVLEVDVTERQGDRFPLVIGALDPEIGSVPLKQPESGDATLPDVQVHLAVSSRTDARH